MELSGGRVAAVTFQNDDTGFAVVKVHFPDQHGLVTCVGIMPSIASGREINVVGHWETSSRYGRQLVVDRYSFSTPTSEEGIIAFLGSGVLPMVGPSRAEQIYKVFGKDSLSILDTAPERLLCIPGIGKKTVTGIKEKWQQDERLRSLLLFLQQFGVSYRMAVKIFKVYGEQAQERISKNPYILCEDISGIGFVKADGIARNIGYAHDSYKRIRAGIIYLLREAAQEGHTCMPVDEVKTRAVALLSVSDERFVFSLDHAVSVAMLHRDGDYLYLPYLYCAEKTVADALRKRSDHHRDVRTSAALQRKATKKTTSPDPSEADHLHVHNFPKCAGPSTLSSQKHVTTETPDVGVWIDTYEKEHNWQADVLQRQAIITAAGAGCMLLTGGPGTGKTTVLKVVVHYFQKNNKTVLCAAPTGRAAQRLKEVTGIPAQTIHRLLEFQPRTVEQRFRRNEDHPLDADIIIVDEVSMMDIQLTADLLKALAPSTRLMLVGDNDQLPSVGPGNVLRDLIESGIIAHIHLDKVFRQAASSRIITAAHEINAGMVPVFGNKKQDDCFFIESHDPDTILTQLLDLVSRRLPASYGFDPLHDIQVLSPMHKGILGTEHLNRRLQESLRTTSRKVETGNKVFYVGDKVMQIRNDYERNVFNGDIGFIQAVDENNELIVDFQGNRVVYPAGSLEELLPAYCISIHKSQGSEFKAIVLPLSTQHFVMLQRNLLYTALTRAKRLCIFIGSKRAMRIAVSTNTVAVRWSCLKERIGVFEPAG